MCGQVQIIPVIPIQAISAQILISWTLSPGGHADQRQKSLYRAPLVDVFESYFKGAKQKVSVPRDSKWLPCEKGP